jgi:threonine dehydratase
VDVVLRQVDEVDWERWRDLRLRMLADTPMAFGETLENARRHDEAEWRFRVRRTREPGNFTVVAQDGGRWVGTMSAFTHPQQGLFLVSVYVDPDHRGGGLADRLLAEVLRWGRNRPGATGMLLHVHEDNPRAQGFYRRWGFTDTGVRVPYDLDPRRREVEMRVTFDEPGLDVSDVLDAARQIHGVAHRTPVLTSRRLDAFSGSQVHLKAENFQRVGAFKFRGAYNVVSRLSPAELERGVLAYSSGNHAQAVALSASMVGTNATIVMPADTPAAKVAATRGYGAEVVFYDRYTQDRVALGNSMAAERGMTIVPPYEHLGVMAGQGTAALELLEDTGPLDTLLVPVGGGGLMAGSSTVAKGLHPQTRVVGVEPELGNDTLLSLRAGHRIRIDVPRTIADGSAAETPGELTFAVNSRRVDDVVLVSDAELRAALVYAFDVLKVVLEPSGACALAAVLFGKGFQRGERVGAILSGGNVGASRFRDLIAPGQEIAEVRELAAETF